MAERRRLIEGLKASDIEPEVANQFIYGEPEPAKPKVGKPAKPETPPAPVPIAPPANVVSRAQLSTRVRTDLASQVKRLSLERQLAGKQPNSLQEIVEEALTVWLQAQGETV